MIAGKDYVYVKKNSSGIIYMYLDEDCRNFYVNSLIYEDVVKWASQLENEQVEVYYL